MGNQLYWADNAVMEEFAPESADLIYMDPPFNSQAQYRLKPSAQGERGAVAFTDTWCWSDTQQATYDRLLAEGPCALRTLLAMFNAQHGCGATLAYLTTLARQLVSAHRFLKKSGSIYLHCHSQYSHYLRLLLETIFGTQNFRNQIVWGYRTGGVSKRHFARKHDVILFFTKSDDYCFNPLRYRSYQKKRYGYNPRYPEHFDEQEKSYYHLAVCRDVWEDIPAIGTDNRQRTGFPTQKPEALLERIITASSHKDQLVVDPFCGSGTTVAVAERLGRRWLGIDSSPVAIHYTQARLEGLGAAVSYQMIEIPDW